MVQAKVLTDCKAVELYVDNTCWVAQSLDGVLEDRFEYQILPSGEYGLVAVIDARYPPLLTKPLYGCLVYRPKLLQLLFPIGVKVHLVTLKDADMRSWCKDSLPWVQVGKRITVSPDYAW